MTVLDIISITDNDTFIQVLNAAGTIVANYDRMVFVDGKYWDNKVLHIEVNFDVLILWTDIDAE